MILVLPRIHAGDLEGSLVGLGARRGEKELGQPLRQNLQQKTAQLHPRIGRVARHDVCQLARLLFNRLNDGLILVPQVAAHQLRGKVEIALAVPVGEVASLGIDDMQRIPALLVAPGAVVQLLGPFEHFLAGHRGVGRSYSLAHDVFPLFTSYFTAPGRMPANDENTGSALRARSRASCKCVAPPGYRGPWPRLDVRAVIKAAARCSSAASP